MSQFYDDENADNILKEITENLSKQVSDELDSSDLKAKADPEGPQRNGKKKKKLSILQKVLIGIGAALVVLIAAIIIVTNSFLDQINYEKEEDVAIIEDDTIDTEATPKPIKQIEPPDKNVINVLLIGEEKMHDTVRGRSDSTMIATINQTQKTIKLTSIMRDCYVSIPEHGQGKLNSAYNIGGGPLLVSAIEQNFEVHLDGYVRVDFDAFETIVDELGGVEIELTQAEADYLNVKDYITKPEYRKVKAGKQILNGNQALGYSRVRYVKGIDGESDDFGRTNRQRTVLNAIFDKYKTKSLFDLIDITNNLFEYIYTDLTKADILSYVAAFVATGSTELETFRIPMNNAYSDGETSKGQSVLMLNFEKNNAALREFIYGVGAEAAGGENEPQYSVPELTTAAP